MKALVNLIIWQQVGNILATNIAILCYLMKFNAAMESYSSDLKVLYNSIFKPIYSKIGL